MKIWYHILDIFKYNIIFGYIYIYIIYPKENFATLAQLKNLIHWVPQRSYPNAIIG